MGARPELAKTPATRYNGGMNQTTLPRTPDLWATIPAREPAPLLEQLVTLRLENAAQRAQNAALQLRWRDMDRGKIDPPGG